MDIEKILTEGIVFRGGKSSDGKKKEEKVKTKAKKKTYITGLHGSGSAKMKAEYRRRRLLWLRMHVTLSMKTRLYVCSWIWDLDSLLTRQNMRIL